MTKAAGGLVDVADLGTDTGWISVNLAAGVTVPSGYHFSYRRLNGVVYIEGRIQPGATNTNVVVTATGFELPVGFRTDLPILDLQIAAALSGTSVARVWTTSAGTISVNSAGSTIGISCNFIPAPA